MYGLFYSISRFIKYIVEIWVLVMNQIIEIIVPCYNEEQCVELFCNKICEIFDAMEKFDFIITFIDDGSKDATLSTIKNMSARMLKGKVQYISFSRNFGKESAIYAGLSNCTGDYIAVMDADLQHPPELLIEMIRIIEEEGYDCCAARRKNRRGEPIIRKFFSNQFYHIMNKLTIIDLVQGSTDFRLMKREMADAVASLTENERFTKGIYAWVGYKTKWIDYENVERAAGKSKWSFHSLFNYAGNGIIAFATTPLRGIVYLGIIVTIVSIIYAAYVVFKAVMYDGVRSGFTTLIVLITFFSGIILTTLGMIGEYVARIYMEVKNRPLYIVKEANLHRNDRQNHVEKSVD